MKQKLFLRRLLALLLPLLLLLPAAQIPAAAAIPAVLRVAVLSDPHLLPDGMTGGFCAAYLADNESKGRPPWHSQTLFESALEEIKQRAVSENLEFLLMPGDLTRDGEHGGHVLMAQLLADFEAQTGVQVAVVPGNHDVLKGSAADYTTGKREQARNITPDEFLAFYGDFGYDLPGCVRFGDTLSYAVDLGADYRLIAMDTSFHRLDGAGYCDLYDLRDWVAAQCAQAKTDGKTVIGMGHHNLGEQIGGQEAVMHNFGFADVRGIAESFAEAGLHFYLSGHLHVNEIAARVSDLGEPLYDITTASTASFPCEYRTVAFTANGNRVEADVRSHAAPLATPPPLPGPYYATLFGQTFGGALGGGLPGNIKGRIQKELNDLLGSMRASGGIEGLVKGLGVDLAPLNALFRYLDQRLLGQPERIAAAVNSLIDEAAALTVSKLPCNKFIAEYGFGHPTKPGTFEDMANTAMVYMFGKVYDPAADPFMQDGLRRLKNGEFLDQALAFAVPKILAALGGDILPLLMNNPAAIRALETLASLPACPLIVVPLLALVVSPARRAALSQSLYGFISAMISSQSPIGARDGTLVYEGPVAVPLDPGTFRLPQEIAVAVDGCQSAKVTWLTRPSAATPALTVTNRNGSPAPEVKVSIAASKPEDFLAERLDIGFAKILGRVQPVLKHTARLTGLQAGKTYLFTAGDSSWEWYAEPRSLNNLRDNPVMLFLRNVWNQLVTWVCGMLQILWRGLT